MRPATPPGAGDALGYAAVASRLDELREPLRSQRLRLLLAAQIVSQLGDWAARLALALLVYDRTESPVQTAIVVAVTMVPWLGIGQMLAGLGDRYGRRRVMIISDLSRAAIFATLVVLDDSPIVVYYVAAFVAGCIDAPFEAARSAAIVDSVPDDDYPDAIALSAGLDQIGLLAGYALGGALVGWIGARGALGVNAASFIVSALLLLRMSPDRPISGRPEIIRVREAIAVIRADRVIVHSMFGFCSLAMFAMAIEAQVAPFGQGELDMPDSQVGILAAMVTIGGIVGTYLMRIRGHDLRLARLTGLSGLIGGLVSLIALSFEPSVALAYVAYLGVGVVFLAAIPANAAFGRRIPDDVRSSTFAIIQGFVLGSQALGALLGGVAANLWGVRETVVVAAAASALSGILVLLSVPRRYLAEELANSQTPVVELRVPTVSHVDDDVDSASFVVVGR